MIGFPTGANPPDMSDNVQNAFEDPEKLPQFEKDQRLLEESFVEDFVKKVIADLPPNEYEVTGIERNIERLKQQGLWATARFYEKLLAARKASEG